MTEESTPEIKNPLRYCVENSYFEGFAKRVRTEGGCERSANTGRTLAQVQREPFANPDSVGSFEPNNSIIANPFSEKYKENKEEREEKGIIGSNGYIDNVCQRGFQKKGSHRQFNGYRKSIADSRVYCYVRSVGLRDVVIIDVINGQHLEIPAVVWEDCFIR